MGHASRGEYLHFRCDQHSQSENTCEVGKYYSFRCDVKGCGRAAKAYWYRGEQFANLIVKADVISFDY